MKRTPIADGLANGLWLHFTGLLKMRPPVASQRAPQRVSIREFKARLSHYLTQTSAGGGVIEVTSHRRVVARVTGVPSEAGEGIARLIALGAASWHGGKPAGAGIRLAKRGRSVSELVLDDRGCDTSARARRVRGVL